jgi:hypothetical protein
MKKILGLIVVMLVILLQSCGMIVVEEDTEEYLMLSDQYNQYITHDAVDFDDFKALMNNVTNQTTLSVFMLVIETKNTFNRVTSRSYQTATLVENDLKYMYLLTTYEKVDERATSIDYSLYDAYGNLLEGELYDHDEELCVIRVEKAGTAYPKAQLTKFHPMNKELVIMISNADTVLNLQKLGFFLYQNEASYVEIKSLESAIGSPVFNLKLELIGIQVSYGVEHALLIDYLVISEFLDKVFST